MQLFLSRAVSSALCFAAILTAFGCASTPEPVSDDEDFTAAQDPREPDRAAVLTALKSVNRTNLMPTSVAFVSQASTHNVVTLDATFNGQLSDRAAYDTALLNRLYSDLKAKRFSIAGKYAKFDYGTCQFQSKGDYLGLSTETKVLSANMIAGNAALSPTVAYTDANIASAKSIEKVITYKLTMTSQRVSLYLGRSRGQWKVLAIDTSEFACVGDGP